MHCLSMSVEQEASFTDTHCCCTLTLTEVLQTSSFLGEHETSFTLKQVSSATVSHTVSLI